MRLLLDDILLFSDIQKETIIIHNNKKNSSFFITYGSRDIIWMLNVGKVFKLSRREIFINV